MKLSSHKKSKGHRDRKAHHKKHPQKVQEQPLTTQKPTPTTTTTTTKRNATLKTKSHQYDTTKSIAEITTGSSFLSPKSLKHTLIGSIKNFFDISQRHFSMGRTGRPAVDPKQTKLSLTKKVETALQLTQFNPATTGSKAKSLNKITHLEKSINGKIEWLETRLSVPVEFLSLHQIQDIYHVFLDIRFTCDVTLWNKVIKMWSAISASKLVEDDRIKQQAQSITMSLLDELVNVQNLGTYTVMKQKQYQLPEHLLKFNLRPTEETYSLSMKTLNATKNYEATLKLYDQYTKVLENIPQTQYMPSPLIPYGPEREQELVQRRLVAQRRQELLHTATNDNYIIEAAVKGGHFDKADQLMKSILTERPYEPSNKAHKLYSYSLVQRSQHFGNIELFKQFFQPSMEQIVVSRNDMMRRRQQALDQCIADGTVEVVTREVVVDDAENDNMLAETKIVQEHRLVSTGHTLNLDLPQFLNDPNMLHATYTPSRESWNNLFKSILALHPILPTKEKSDDNNNDNAEQQQQVNNTTETRLITTSNNNQDKDQHYMKQYLMTQSSNYFDKNPAVRKHVYKIAKEQYGLILDSTFFTPMIENAPNHEVMCQYLNDFHEEIEALAQKAKKNPWTAEEVAEQVKEKKLRSMLVVDLNVIQHDDRMKQVFGRYKDEAEKLGYNQKFYSKVQEKLLVNLVDAYVNDNAIANEISREVDEFDSGVLDFDDEGNAIVMRAAGPEGDDAHGDGTLFSKFGKKKRNKKHDDDNDDDDDNNDDNNNNNNENIVKNKKVDFKEQNLVSNLYSGVVQHREEQAQDDTFDILTRQIEAGTVDNNTNTDANADQQKQQQKTSALQKRQPTGLIESPIVSTITKLSKDTINTMLGTTRRQKVKGILTAVNTLRAYQNAYGLPPDPRTESNYLESLILMTRRNEVYPPVLGSNENSLIKLNVAPYIPTFENNHKAQQNNLKNQPILKNFKDRIKYIHDSLLQREQQMKVTIKEIEQSIDTLSSMKNELDEETRDLKQVVHLQVLSNAIEALSELGCDAAHLRGPFEAENLFIYDGARASHVLTRIANGEDVPGVKVDERDGTKYVPGVTEPAEHQIDNVDLALYTGDANKVKDECFMMMKSLLQKLLAYADGMTTKQTQGIKLLQPDVFGGMVTEKTYMPLLKVCAAHGDYTNILLLVESAHQHRGVVPTTNMLNQVAVAFINSSKPRNAAGVLDIMLNASKQQNVHTKNLSEKDLQTALIHGNAAELLERVQQRAMSNLDENKVLPNMQTIALLLHMYKSQGMLDHCEELWRRLCFHDETSWASFSAVEEQQLITEVLANELDNASTGVDPLYEAIRNHKFKTEDPSLSLGIEDAYDKVLNPKKNPAMRDAVKHDEIRTNMQSLLRNRRLPTTLPSGAHREDISSDYKYKALRLDSATTTTMMQTFIQLGHPMHALQLYLDVRQKMPAYPIVTPQPSLQYQKAIHANRLVAAQEFTAAAQHNNETNPAQPADPLTQLLNRQKHHGVVNDLLKSFAIPIAPTKQSAQSLKQHTTATTANTSDNGLMVLHNNNGQQSTGQNRYDAHGNKLRKQIRYNMAAFTPRMVAAGTTRASRTTQAVNIAENALINIQNNEELFNNRFQGDEQSAFDALTKTQWPEVDALASVAVYTLRKAQKFIDLYQENEQEEQKKSKLKRLNDNDPNRIAQKQIHEQALLLVETATQVLSHLKRYAVDHPYLPGDETAQIYFSQPQTHNNILPTDCGLELTQPRLIVPYTMETEQLYQYVDSLVYSDVTFEETMFKFRNQQAQNIAPIGMKRWFTIFPAMINQCKAIYQQYDEKSAISEQIEKMREQVQDMVAVGRKQPKQPKQPRQHRELVDENGNVVVEDDFEADDELAALAGVSGGGGETDTSLSSSINIAKGLRNNTQSKGDRGISYPTTSAFTKDVKVEAPKKDTLLSAKLNNKFLGNFQAFLQQQSEVVKAIPVADVPVVAEGGAVDPAAGAAEPQELSIQEKERIKAKLLAQTMNKKAPITNKNHPAFKKQEKEAQQQQEELEKQNAYNLSLGLPQDDQLFDLDNAVLNNPDGTTAVVDNALKPLVNLNLEKKQQEREAFSTMRLPEAPHIVTGGEDAVREKKEKAFQQRTQEFKMQVAKGLQDDLDNSIPLPSEQLSSQHNFNQKKAHKDLRGSITGISASNKLLLPEVGEMKSHLTTQSTAQKKAIDSYENKRKDLLRRQKASDTHIDQRAFLEDNSFVQKQMDEMEIISSAASLANKVMTKTNNNISIKQRQQTTAAEWLTSPTDLAHAKIIAQRHADVQKRREMEPGVIEEFQTSPSAHLMAKLQQTTPQAESMTRARPGGVNTSPFGPESFLPPDQFRAPSTMAKLINEENPDESKFALSTEKQKFTLATHGVAYSDRPGIPTKISQEYLEKMMGLDADPKDKINQKRHKEMAEEYDGIMMDSSFIKPGGYTEMQTKASEHKHAEGYGSGVHLFRQRTGDKDTSMAQSARDKLLQEFSNTQLVQQQTQQGMSKAEKESQQYADLFQIGDNVARTGQYTMLTKEDQVRRDNIAKDAGFADLEGQLDMLMKTRGSEKGLGDFTSKSADYSFNDKTAEKAESRKVKELFSTALNQPNDRFGVYGKNTKGRSTLLD